MPTIIVRERKEGEEPMALFTDKTFVEELTSPRGNALTGEKTYQRGLRRAAELTEETGVKHECLQYA